MNEDIPLILAERETPFWGFGEVFVVFALAVVAFVVVGTVGVTLLPDSARLGYWAVLEESVAYLLIFASIKILFFWQGQPLLRSLAFVRSPLRPMTLIYTGLTLVLISVFIANLTRTPDVSTPFQEMLNTNTLSRVSIAIFGVTLGPLVEELLFRGFLQPVLTNAAGVFPGILITSVLFGALHLSQNANLWQSGLVIAIAGFGFGLVRHLTGSTRASTLTHVAYNTLPCLMTLIQPLHK